MELLATDLVLLNHCQVRGRHLSWNFPLLTSTPLLREDIENVHQCSLHGGFSVAPGFEPTMLWIQVHDHNHYVTMVIPQGNDEIRNLIKSLRDIINSRKMLK
ncbi:uncharacterized protein TNCV_2264421 [Trichonephila clavipes]|nr:uncharacterized protein TNCV_2264421 [Trichonephila clavipes]